MPHLIAVYRDAVDEDSRVLGICEYTKRGQFEDKLSALCQAMGWHVENVQYIHCYDNHIINSFESV